MVHKLPQHYTCLRITETTPLKIEFTHFRGPHREDMFERRRHCPDRSNIPQGRHMRDSQGRHIRAVEGQHAACYWSNSAVQQPFSQHSNPAVPRPCVHAGSTTSSLTAMRPRRDDYNKHTVPCFFLIYSSTDSNLLLLLSFFFRRLPSFHLTSNSVFAIICHLFFTFLAFLFPIPYLIFLVHSSHLSHPSSLHFLLSFYVYPLIGPFFCLKVYFPLLLLCHFIHTPLIHFIRNPLIRSARLQ